MKLVSVRDLRTKPAEIWKKLEQEQELVLTNNGKPIGIVAPVDEDSLEDSLKMLRRLRAMRAVEQIRLEAARTGRDKITLEEINAEIQAVRRTRRR